MNTVEYYASRNISIVDRHEELKDDSDNDEIVL